MSSDKITRNFQIRRYDKSVYPEIIQTRIDLDKNFEYSTLKKRILSLCGADPEDDKLVVKLRLPDQVLVPFSILLDTTEAHRFFFLDICNINYATQLTATLLQDTYKDSVCEKLKGIEARISQAEMLLPQLEWRRQAYMEETVENLSSRVAFLNRRFDELLPTDWKMKMPQPVS